MNLARISIGLPGATDPEVIAALAPRIEQLGFRALWLNDTPNGDSLAGLAVAASVTRTLVLATGVIPLDRRPAATIAAAIEGLPVERLELGIGAGGPTDALARVRAAVALLRHSTPAAILVGALGPRMRDLGSEVADGLLFNWLTPRAAAFAAIELRATSPKARAVLYARAIVDRDARPALEEEAARYGANPVYAANLERIGATAMDATIDGSAPGALAARADQYLSSLDELVLRAVTAPGGDLERFVERAAT